MTKSFSEKKMEKSLHVICTKDTTENFKHANQTQHTDLMVVFQEKHYIIIVSSSPCQQTKQK